ncbi:MAG: hypothetical protein ACHBN1_32060 [Heteroscytonema crispum UTEX LB 1556]
MAAALSVYSGSLLVKYSYTITWGAALLCAYPTAYRSALGEPL